jgi:TPR repeat protein
MRSAIASSFITLFVAGLIAFGIGHLDSALAPIEAATRSGVLLLRVGAAAMAIGLIGWVASAARDRTARVRSAIIAAGVWPFLAFALFIGWRIGVAAEQAALCEAGAVQQCFDLGKRKQRRAKPDEAAVWYTRGCDADHAPSCLGLAAVTDDDEQAAAALRDACALDSGPGCDRLARLLRRGAVRERTDDEANLAEQRACGLGIEAACTSGSTRPVQTPE